MFLCYYLLHLAEIIEFKNYYNYLETIPFFRNLGGYERVERQGENGLEKVTKKYQYINGQLADTVNVSSTEIKPAVNQILIKGEKYVPEVADLSYWAWPTPRPYTITSPYEYRWGTFHSAIDIAGTGYGSDIYAANNGTVHTAEYGCAAAAGAVRGVWDFLHTPSG